MKLLLIVGFALIRFCVNEVTKEESISDDGSHPNKKYPRNESDIDFDNYETISKLENVKGTIMGDLTEIYEAARYPESSSKSQLEVNITKTDLPSFSDPFQVGNYTEGYVLGHIDLYDVRVNELDNYSSSKMQIDYFERKITLELKYEKIIIAGIYAVGSFLQGSKGHFAVNIKSAKYARTTTFTINSQTGEIHLSEEHTSKFDYDTTDSTYDNLSFITKMRQNAIDSKLVDDVTPKIQRHIDEKLKNYAHLQTFMKGLSPKDMAKRNLKKYMAKMIQNCSPTTLGTNRQIELLGESFEILHDDQYLIKVTKMSLNDWQSFDATKLDVVESVDRVKIMSGVILKKVLVSALINIRNLKNPKEPFIMKNIVYEVDAIDWITTSVMEKIDDHSNAFVPRKISVFVGELRLSNELQYDEHTIEYFKNTIADKIHYHFVRRIIKFSIDETKARVYKRLILPAAH